ncbi:MAG: sodium:solute symporter family protein [Planctomycetota bacterium]|jgi:Na+/proline symporter
MTIFGIHLVDFLVVVAYLAGICVIGVWMVRWVKNTTDFFIGNWRFGKLLLMMHAFGTGTSSEMPVAVASKSFQGGFSGIWTQWLYLFITPFYWLFAPWYRRLRCVTIGDMYEMRFSRSLSVFYTIFSLVFFIVYVSLGLKATSETVAAVSGGKLSADAIVIFMAVLVAIYGSAGGLRAVIITDFIQGLLIIVLSFLLIPFGLRQVGGFAALHDKIDAAYFNLTSPAGFTVFYVVMVTFAALSGIVAQPHHMEVIGSGKTEYEGRVGYCYGCFVKRLCTVGWTFVGVMCIALYAGVIDNADRVFGYAVKHLLPTGCVGLMIVAMMATVMSSCDSFMVDASAVFTRNLYRHIRPDRGEKHYLYVGRIVGVLVVAGGVAAAFLFPSIFENLKVVWDLPAFWGASFWLGMLWRRATSRGVWFSVIGTMAVYIFFKMLMPIPKFGVYMPEFLLRIDSHAELIAVYLPTSFVLMVLGSLLSQREKQEKLDAFYARVHTPVSVDRQQDKKNVQNSIENPGRFDRHRLTKWGDLELLTPGRVDTLGFLLAWLCVAAILGIALFLIKFGG